MQDWRGQFRHGALVALGVFCAFGANGRAVAGPSSTSAQWPRVRSEVPRSPQIERRIATILQSLTLEQKIGQMVQPEIRYATPQDARTYRFGSILNGGGSWPGNNKRASVADWV